MGNPNRRRLRGRAAHHHPHHPLDRHTTRHESRVEVRGTQALADAEKLRTKLLAELDQTGPSHAGPDGTMTTLLNRWFAARAPAWSVATVAEHRRIIDNRLTPGIGKLTVSEVKPDHLDHLYAQLLTTGNRNGGPLSAGTVQRVHVVAHSALEQAVRWGWIVANPADRATPPRAETLEPSPAAPAVVAKVLAAAEARNPVLGLYLRLAAVTGARRGELCALRWSRVDQTAGQVTISRALAIGVGGVVDQPTKTRRSRVIALDSDTLARLAFARRETEALAEACGGHLPADAYVFTTEVDGGRPMRPEWFTKQVTGLAADLGAEGVTIRHLRHYVATQLLTAGVPIHTVARRLGHARTSTTLDIYGHAIAADDQAAAGHLQTLLEPR